MRCPYFTELLDIYPSRLRVIMRSNANRGADAPLDCRCAKIAGAPELAAFTAGSYCLDG
jgi:hypothetical protein